MRLNEFAPDEGNEGRKYIPWTEFIEQLKQILHKDFDCKESQVKDIIKAKFVPYDPMEFGPTMIYSYYERRLGRQGANSIRAQIQVGKFHGTGNNLTTGFQLLKGTEFERYFDLTFENLYKIANIIKGNRRGALEQNVAEGLAPGQAAWKKEMIAKGAVKFWRDKHGGGTVDRILAYNKDGEVIGGFNQIGRAHV